MLACKLSLMLILGSTLITPAQSPGWRGIVPLKSTRADVERLIGKPNLDSHLYSFQNERANILYSVAPCTEGMEGEYNVPRDTVISSLVVPQSDLRLVDLHLNPDKYNKEDVTPEGYWVYRSGEEGVSYVVERDYVTKQELVTRIVYFAPDKEDKTLRCKVSADLTSAEN